MLSIGELARASGLGVSALRFYDGAGVFTPVRVDPRTGYRWYAPEQVAAARLLARLRRVGMPLAGIGQVLGEDATAARAAVDRHLRQLEDGLADARRELSAVRDLIDLREHPMTATTTRLTAPAPALAAALDAVRFAAGSDPEHPVVRGILFDPEPEGGLLRLVATDRYRLAVASAPATVDGPAAQVLVPTALADAARPLLAGAESVELTVEGNLLSFRIGDNTLTGERLDLDFPDYRRLTRIEATHRLEFAAAELRAQLENGPAAEDGTALLAADGLQVRVNRDYLLQAVTAGAAEQLVLELDTPITPLAIRFPSRADTFSLLMPIAG
ncbi:DNA polymerase III subunit beta family protein [Kitasatospora sp. NPDC001664]|uniref:DNA polymerase III subunit beta family protein n=1 Tax=Kitasatospora albolonga TaxID=68173 RepID=UPI0035E9D738